VPRKVVTISLLIILLSFAMISGNVQPATADIADTVYLRTGGTISNSSSISMPEADAHIKIVRNTSGSVTVNVSCDFQVVSTKTTNASLAFVYPEAWRVMSGQPEVDFAIHVNHMMVNQTVMTYENLTSEGFVTDPEQFENTWLEHAEFVLFTFEMIADQSYNVNVRTNAYPLNTAYYGSFTYIVASASTFLGETHQTVEIFVVEEEPFLSYTFIPEDYLVETSNESGTIATWDFIIDESSNITQVQMSYVENEYHGIRPPSQITYLLVLIIGTFTVIAIALGIWSRRHV